MKNQGLRGLFLVVALCVTTHAGRAVFPGYDWQVMDWKNRSNTNNGSITTSQNADVSCSTELAATEFMRAIRTAGFYPSATNQGKILRLNLFAGNDFHTGLSDTVLGAVQTPLIIDKGTVKDTTVAAQGGWRYVEQGATGGLSSTNTGFLLTGFNPSTMMTTTNSAGFAVYVCSTNTETAFQFGGQDAGGGNKSMHLLVSYTGVGTRVDLFSDAGAALNGSDFNHMGLYSGSRTNSSTVALYLNGVVNTTGTGGGGFYSADTFVFALNNNGASTGITAKRLGGYEINTGYTAAQVLDDYNAWQRFQTMLGRQK